MAQRIYRRIKPINTLFQLDNVYHKTNYLNNLITMQNEIRFFQPLHRPFVYSRNITIKDTQQFIQQLGKQSSNKIGHSWFIEQDSWNTIYDSTYVLDKKMYLVSRQWYNDHHMFHLLNYIPYNQHKQMWNDITLTNWCPNDVDRSDTVMGYVGRKDDNGGETLERRIGWESYDF